MVFQFLFICDIGLYVPSVRTLEEKSKCLTQTHSYFYFSLSQGMFLRGTGFKCFSWLSSKKMEKYTYYSIENALWAYEKGLT